MCILFLPMVLLCMNQADCQKHSREQNIACPDGSRAEDCAKDLPCGKLCIECQNDTGHCLKCDDDWTPDGPDDQKVCLSCFSPNWGIHCEKPCGANCIQCWKDNGTCMACAAGWRQSNMHACLKLCPKMTFGINCQGLCQEKCQQDCLDRVTGACVAKAEQVLHLVRTCLFRFDGGCFWFTMAFVLIVILLCWVAASSFDWFNFLPHAWRDRVQEFKTRLKNRLTFRQNSLAFSVTPSMFSSSELDALSDIYSSVGTSFCGVVVDKAGYVKSSMPWNPVEILWAQKGSKKEKLAIMKTNVRSILTSLGQGQEGD